MLDKVLRRIESFEGMDTVADKWNVPILGEEISKRMSQYYPLILPYFLELNPSFVFQYQSLETMFSYPMVMLRDGYYGLSYLFLRNTKFPKNIDTIFLIPKKFSCLIPESWSKNVLLYSFEFDKEKRDLKRQIVYGYGADENFLRETAEEKVKKIIDKNIPLSLLSGYRYNFLEGSVDRVDRFYEVHSCLSEYYGASFNLVDNFNKQSFGAVGREDSFKSLDDDHFTIYDDFLQHYFAATGALNLNHNEQTKSKDALKINLSLYHKIVIEEPVDFSKNIIKEAVKLSLKSNSLNIVGYDFYNYCLNSYRKSLGV